VGHEEVAIYEVDIGFHAAESVVKRIEQRAFMLVIVVGVRVYERLDGEGRKTGKE